MNKSIEIKAGKNLLRFLRKCSLEKSLRRDQHKHNYKVLSKQDIENNRSNAYTFII